MTRRLEDRVALVTGGASGIGAAIARRLAGEGAHVAIVDIDADGAERVAAQLREAGSGVDVEAGDVTEPSFPASAVERLAAAGTVPDVLVNAAGVRTYRPLLEIDDELVERHHRVNVMAPIRWTQALARALIERGKPGSIVNVLSVMAVRGYANNAAYAASKAGLLGFARCAAVELAPHGIRVNAIAPGPTSTPMTAEIMADAGTRSRLTGRIPLGRVGEPEDMAGATVFLASDESSFITGTTVGVDGGYLLL